MSNAERETDSTGAVCSLDSEEEETDRSHLEEVDDGCGCTEIWEHLSEQRDE